MDSRMEMCLVDEYEIAEEAAREFCAEKHIIREFAKTWIMALNNRINDLYECNFYTLDNGMSPEVYAEKLCAEWDAKRRAVRNQFLRRNWTF